MQLGWHPFKGLIFALCFYGVFSLPSSLVDEIKASESGNNKVKRAQQDNVEVGESSRQDVPYYTKPSAIKRGAGLKSSILDEADWDQDQTFYQNLDNLDTLKSTLYNNDDFDGKTLSEYEKGFQYGANKDKLDQALENAVLKSEIYGDPSSVNQYRYYGAESKKRKRRNARKLRLANRLKREIDLTPEEFFTILALYENEHQNKPVWRKFDRKFDSDGSQSDLGDDEENWLDNPVYPHVGHTSADVVPQYPYEESSRIFRKRGRWGGFLDNRNKRYMVAKNDPTREIRYLNGPSKNDYYTLSQLLSAQRDRDPDVPLYHRLVL